MDSFELNKIFGAILGTLVFVIGIGFVAEGIYAPIEGKGPGYTLPEPEGDGHGAVEVAEVVATPLPVLLASASAENGAKVAKKCVSCHNFEKGGSAIIGPALFGIVGHKIGNAEGFSYSDSLGAMNAEGAEWTYENLNHFLTSPKTFAPGTKMSFAGLKSETDRADILAYLQSLSDAPVAFPAADAMPAADAPANGEAAPTAAH